MPAHLSFEQLNNIQKGKGVILPDCQDFLGEHWCVAPPCRLARCRAQRCV